MTVRKLPATRSRRLRTREVAALTGVCVETLRSWRHEDRGPVSYTLEGTVVYDEADVEAWIAAQKSATARGGAR